MPSDMSIHRDATADKPRTMELALIGLTGFVHVAIEIFCAPAGDSVFEMLAPQRIYNIAVAVLWSCYVAWRLMTVPGIAARWGFRGDNLLTALVTSLLAALPFAALLIAYGALMGRLPVPASFWMILVLYPVWGLAQQFALQVLIVSNLRGYIANCFPRALAASVLFSAAHLPNAWTTGLTLPAGLLFTWLYERHRNVWAVGITHGVLGALAYYLVLGEDPGSKLVGLMRRVAEVVGQQFQ
jgi:membrane protease YdiL (CAAX protease family)